jgi:hypothetical protein
LKEEKEDVFKYLVDFFSKEFNQVKEIEFLIVLDNLENINEKSEDISKNGYSWIEYFLVNMPRNVQVLITCRNANIFKKEFEDLDQKVKKVEVKYFLKEQAETYFYKNKNIDGQRNFSEQDKKSLEKYFSETEVLAFDLNLLVQILKDEDFDVSYFFKRDGNISQKIFDELYKQIKNKSKKAWEALEYISFIDPDAIPIDLVKGLSEIYDKTIFRERILGVLEDNGVVEIYRIDEEVLLKVHRRSQVLVKIIVKNNKKEETIVNKLKDVLEKEMPFIDDLPDEKWKKLNRLIPHFLKAVENKKTNDYTWVNIFGKISVYYDKIKFDQEEC